VAQPVLPAGEVRVGGFGGVDGLAAWLREQHVAAVIDATHPFAATMTEHAVAACHDTGVPLLLLRRPAWSSEPGDRWHHVGSLAGAAAAVGALGSRVLLTTGRRSLAGFTGVPGRRVVLRSVDPPDGPLPDGVYLVLDRGPFTLDGERDLLRRHRIDVVVTKNSGGTAVAAKLVAARERGLPVVVVDRPPAPDAPAVDDVAGAVAWLAGSGLLDRGGSG
jgi:precorrin-6A/cobalt-precorrin-6A reductase